MINQQTVEVWIPPQFKELFNPTWRNIIYYGGRGSTKSHSIARALVVLGRASKFRILCAREILNSIEDSSFQLLKDIIELYGFKDYTYTNNSIVNQITGTTFIFKGLRKGTTNSIKSLEGIDKCWVEEAHSVTEDSLNILSPTIRKDGAQLIFSYNRLNELDPVHVKYVMNAPPNTYSRMVNYTDIEQYGIFPEVLKVEAEYDKVNNYELYAHKWLGEPMGQAEMAIIGRTRVMQSMQRQVKDDGAIIIGADIARMGGDRTVFWKRKGLKTLETQVHTKLRTTQICDVLEQFANFNKSVELKIDDTGVGGGVTDEMMKRLYNVRAINFGSIAQDTDKYPNWISEAWFHLAEIIDEVQLPMDSDLLMELSTRQWAQDNKGKRRVESKGDYKKRGFRSPDLADACIICYGAVNEPGMLGFLRQASMNLTDNNAVDNA